MPITISCADGDIELRLYRGANGGDIEITMSVIEDGDSWEMPLGQFRIRDLLIALHALDGISPTPDPVPASTVTLATFPEKPIRKPTLWDRLLGRVEDRR